MISTSQPQEQQLPEYVTVITAQNEINRYAQMGYAVVAVVPGYGTSDGDVDAWVIMRLVRPTLTAVLESGSSDMGARVEALEARLNDEVPGPAALAQLFNRVEALERIQDSHRGTLKALCGTMEMLGKRLAGLEAVAHDRMTRLELDVKALEQRMGRQEAVNTAVLDDLNERLVALEANARPVPGCERCEGEGVVDVRPTTSGATDYTYKVPCPVCGGSGKREAQE